MNTYQIVNTALDIDKRIRAKYSKTRGYFNPSKATAPIRILPLVGDQGYSVPMVEHKIRVQDPQRGEITEKHLCWTEWENPASTVVCPFCKAYDIIQRDIKEDPSQEEELSPFIMKPSENEWPIFDSPAQTCYMNVVDRGRPDGENPLIFGCSQQTLKRGFGDLEVAWPQFYALQNGNDLTLRFNKINYTIMPHAQTPLHQDRGIVNAWLGKRMDFKPRHRISISDAIAIVDSWIDLGEDWYNA